ncbi:AraC family transcriptional regulator [Ciceribacter sp. L1K22]|uniref:helix-turn-helix domain-containing protein n=1 Tax=Ciceribacter sp. L1K22 TaxID=2820275 RepID=UPI001ABEBF61|nr:AraC family transcriptional regulator [Ciceribacter sp. L1K22]MBO3759869.1 helix-turn-helix transcriptional regulator [Ciceribacter sp. L1K22]
MTVLAIFFSALLVGQTVMIAALLLRVPSLRNPANTALALGMLAIAVSCMLDSMSAFAEAGAGIRLIAGAMLTECVAAAALYIHLQWIRRLARLPELARHAVFILPAILASLPGIVLSERMLGGITGHPIAPAAATMALALSVGLVSAVLLQAAYLSAAIAVFLKDRRSFGATMRRWQSMVITSLALLWLIAFAARIGGLTGTIGDEVSPLVECLFSIVLSLLIWSGLGSAQVLQHARTSATKVVAAAIPKYRRSALTPQRGEDIMRRAKAALLRDRLFADPSLTLPKLAKQLSVSPNDLSQALNQTLGQNFTAFVNEARVCEAERLLKEPGHATDTVLGIAYAVGFNAKSTFNTAFVRKNGMTPSEFRKAGAV